jgi:hypothetical protein
VAASAQQDVVASLVAPSTDVARRSAPLRPTSLDRAISNDVADALDVVAFRVVLAAERDRR